MPKKRDILLIVAVVLVAGAMLGVSKLMPKTDLSTKTADVTLAPDAIEYVDATPAPTEAPAATEVPAVTEAPTAVPQPVALVTADPAADAQDGATAVPQPISFATEAPTAEPTQEPTAAPTQEPTAEPTEAPAAEQQGPAMMGPMPPKKAETIRGHVLLTVGGRQYGDPIPMDRDKIITLRQEDGKINKVHITPESVYMESSTCENQDCVGQGEVHVDTYKDRILSTYIICLPNNVSIEMVPAE